MPRAGPWAWRGDWAAGPRRVGSHLSSPRAHKEVCLQGESWIRAGPSQLPHRARVPRLPRPQTRPVWGTSWTSLFPLLPCGTPRVPNTLSHRVSGCSSPQPTCPSPRLQPIAHRPPLLIQVPYKTPALLRDCSPAVPRSLYPHICHRSGGGALRPAPPPSLLQPPNGLSQGPRAGSPGAPGCFPSPAWALSPFQPPPLFLS